MLGSLLLVIGTLAAGCSGGEEPAERGVLGARAEACAAGDVRPLETRPRAWAGIVRERAVAHRSPGRRPFAAFGRRNVNGVPTVLGLRAVRVDARCRPTWYRAQLPLRPNGVQGWIRAADLQVAQVETRIVVDLSERRVTLFRGGRRVLSAPAAIGTEATPTPTGEYYVNQRLVPTDPTGPFGPGAIGVSAFSPVLTGWAQGGPIAIHGTNRPELIGQAVSNGCIRVRNDVLRRLWDDTLAGTPVVIRS